MAQTLNATFRTLTVALALSAFAVPASAEQFANSGTGSIDYEATPYQASMRCKDLIATSNYDYTVISAKQIAASGDLPEHCRVSGLVQSEVRFEVNLPLAWNGRLYMYGNGGLAGTPADDPGKQLARNRALRRNFATAYTDTGHDRRAEPGGTFAHNNFHKLVDYGFRAVHLTVTSAKRIAHSFFTQAPNHSYWDGCSTGGRQAMISAQRFPDDFDGIVAGAPAADYSGLKFSQAWRVSAITRSGLEEAEVVELSKHIYARCDAVDGLRDGLISDPRVCDFNVEHLPKCQGEDTVQCFDDQEINALKQYYAPVVLAGEEIYPAIPVGSEVVGATFGGTQRTGWFPWLINPNGRTLLDELGSDFFRYMVFFKDRPDFDWTEFDYVTHPDGLEEFRAVVDALDPDLSRLKARGGKILSYFGWADPDINPLTLISYRDQVQALDSEVDDYFRVFLLPGVFHCRGGAGPDRFDSMTPLVDWVENEVAPAQFDTWQELEVGQRSNVRPTCAYPKSAKHIDGKFQCQ